MIVINGESKVVEYDLDESALNTSLREILFKGWSGNPCPSNVVLRELLPRLSAEERKPFCIASNDTTESLGVQLGERDAYGRCAQPSRSYCEFVMEKKDAAVAVAVGFAGTVGGATAATTAAGVTAVTHSSGAVILTGSAGYIGGTLGAVGATAVSLATAPLTLAAAAVTAVGVGGSIYVCGERE